MKCAYCGKEAKGTKEHLISKSVLDLFPECYLTYDDHHNRVYPSDPVIGDVCAECNNKKLSYIDSYAKTWIEEHCIKQFTDSNVEKVDYEYVMLQKVLLKYAYNIARAEKVSVEFFDKDVIDFLLDEQNDTPKEYVSILGGRMPCIPPFVAAMQGNKKIQSALNPTFMIGDTIDDYNAGRESRTLTFPDLKFSCTIRFDKIQFVLLCWQSSSELICYNENIIKHFYPYALLDNSNTAILPICANMLNYFTPRVIQPKHDQLFLKDKIWKEEHRDLFTEQLYKELENKEHELARKHPRK